MNFILRKVLNDGTENNQIIGNDYSFVNRETQYDEFRKIYKVAYGTEHVADLDEMSNEFSKKCYGIIVINQGNELIPLYKGQYNYIMTESGRTFNNLTYK